MQLLCFYSRSLFHVALFVCEDLRVKIQPFLFFFPQNAQSWLQAPSTETCLFLPCLCPRTLNPHGGCASKWSVSPGFMIRFPPQRLGPLSVLFFQNHLAVLGGRFLKQQLSLDFHLNIIRSVGGSVFGAVTYVISMYC